MLIFVTPVLGGYGIVSAAPQTYESYQTGSSEYCDSGQRPWNTGSTLVPEIDYPEFTTTTVNAALARWREGTIGMSDDEKIRIRRDLDPVTIGEYRGLKTLEVSRIMYRTRLNSLFACGIVASRIDSIANLKELIVKKIKNKDSEIYQKLRKEVEKLEKKRNDLKCNIEGSDGKKQEMIINTINSSSHQYCHYRYYLSYLESNISDITQAQTIESGIGQGAGTQISTNTSGWVASSNRYSNDIAREINRADTTLPKAIRSWAEMDQTYGVHVLLTLVYDDYIRLRKALSSYMNISSQLYQKVNNAQILPQ